MHDTQEKKAQVMVFRRVIFKPYYGRKNFESRAQGHVSRTEAHT